MPLFALFLVIPLVEIMLFIQVGQLIGLGWVLLIVVFTAILGTWLIRQQGRGVMRQLMETFNDMRDPTEPLAHGAMVLFAGALLVTPGFFTDTLGFLLLIPKVRETVFRRLRSQIVVRTTMATGTTWQTRTTERPGDAGDVIEGDFQEIDPEARRTNGPSGWTRD
ncbi:FxsA family protein [Tropicimonas sp. IMCC34043]|uniref:FxsA family protein n=1 Tax=Tropicimonas sp. IMCC34043 TaxID=2248760 RepID=UPI000E274635|nr:FxsA family protein [Tropicimonas sp. IMCC34043]